MTSTQERGRFLWNEYASLQRTATDACVIWTGSIATSGYPHIGGTTLHRQSCWDQHGPPPSPKHQAAHSCGNRACINPRHLRWATRSENEADKVTHGRSNRGSRQGRSKLNEDQVHAIRQRLAAGGRPDVIGRDFGVARQTINEIRAGRNWGWLAPRFDRP